MKRFLVTSATVGVFGIVLLALASQALGSITAPVTPWADDGTGGEVNLVPNPSGGSGQYDIMDHLYGVNGWKQVSDQTQLYNPDGHATATAKYAGDNETVYYIGANTKLDTTPLCDIPAGSPSFLSRQTPVLLPVDAHENYILEDVTGGYTWYSMNQSSNSDGQVHAVVFQIVNVPEEYVVAFEDLPIPGADCDFNDVVMQLDGVQSGSGPPVPEPCSVIVWSLLGAIAITVGWRRRKTA